jgi:hypothetical protein
MQIMHGSAFCRTRRRCCGCRWFVRLLHAGACMDWTDPYRTSSWPAEVRSDPDTAAAACAGLQGRAAGELCFASIGMATVLPEKSSSAMALRDARVRHACWLSAIGSPLPGSGPAVSLPPHGPDGAPAQRDRSGAGHRALSLSQAGTMHGHGPWPSSSSIVPFPIWVLGLPLPTALPMDGPPPTTCARHSLVTTTLPSRSLSATPPDVALLTCELVLSAESNAAHLSRALSRSRVGNGERERGRGAYGCPRAWRLHWDLQFTTTSLPQTCKRWCPSPSQHHPFGIGVVRECSHGKHHLPDAADGSRWLPSLCTAPCICQILMDEFHLTYRYGTGSPA